ncbi:Proto-oncogene DBL [Liparis tanakae]|uniref:Proto-oncogene DBL n=1 Tax=Liparis tanakae TaxID=230148 RepID=A0A4Z2E1H1_9TELE|nr:Proto-oncogene DBL [Liparis tanakae]
MRELIDTERLYVEELLSVLLGYRAEMDNPALPGPLPSVLRSKRDVLFGNMPEIYNFHSRSVITTTRVSEVNMQTIQNTLLLQDTCGADETVSHVLIWWSIGVSVNIFRVFTSTTLTTLNPLL